MSSTTGQAGWTVFVLPSSHNDIGWAGTPSEIAEHRATAVIDAVLSLMEEDPEFAFAIEAGLYLREYQERCPERMPLVEQFMNEGRLEIGGSYIQPYEGLLTGEALVRQINWGRGWTGQEFGVQANGYWNIDVAGRTRQIPQVLAKSGIEYMVLSRNQPGLYWWEAPDGSRVLVLSFMEGSYGHSPIMKPLTRHLSPLEASSSHASHGDVQPEQIAGMLIPLLEKWEPYFERYSLPRNFLVIAAADYSVPDRRLRGFIDRWNESSASGELALPFPVNLRFGNAAQYIAAMEEQADLSGLDVVHGELPNPWVYIHGAAHHKTVDAMRTSAGLLDAAETFASALMMEGDDIPARETRSELDLAWLDHLYPDHGYGGLHGEGTDEVFRQKEESALHRSRKIARALQTQLARNVPLDSSTLRHVTVFNALSWSRTDWVETDLIFEAAENVSSIELLDADGAAVPFQAIEVVRLASGLLTRLRVGFIAADIPSIGYRTYAVLRGHAELTPNPTRLNSLVPADYEWENDNIRVRATRGGIVEFHDLHQRRNVICPDYYLGFEVIELGSPGHDVGEGERDITIYDWEANKPFQPTTHGLERTHDRGSELRLLEDGPIRTRIRTESNFTNCHVVQTFSFYRSLDRIDASIEIQQWNGAHGRELRLMVPFGAPEGEVSYDVPFGHLVAGQDEAHSFASLRPREAQTWLHAASEHIGLTLSSSVITHDWVDPAGEIVRPVLQAILLATKRSCHPKGPWYSQEGNHTFTASISGSPRSISERHRFGWECNRPMEVLVTSAQRQPPARRGDPIANYLSIEQSNIALSAIKPGEGPGEIVVRCWETQGIDTRASLSIAAAVGEIWECDLLEHEQRQAGGPTTPGEKIGFDVPANGIVTLKLRLEPSNGIVV